MFAHDLDYSPSELAPTGTTSGLLGGARHASGLGPSQVWLDNESAVNSISPHPYNPALFITASSDGSLRQFDSRSDSGRAVAAIFDRLDMTHVQHHPVTPEVFVYSGEAGALGLIDGRTGWGAPGDGLDLVDMRVASQVAVHKVSHLFSCHWWLP